jgi:ubiquinone/menaquinone biosynthesis C-methylase UbiE
MFLQQYEITGNNRRYQRFYDITAPFYDFKTKIVNIFRKIPEELLKKSYLNELEISPSSKVLEVSIGTGRNIKYLPENANYFGLDLSLGMLKRCQRNTARWNRAITLVHGLAEQLPFKDNSFDVVFHIGGINFFNSKSRAISEMIRVAKPGTKILILDETEKAINWAGKIPILSRFLKYQGEQVTPPLHHIPSSMQALSTKYILNDNFYMITFRKPL